LARIIDLPGKGDQGFQWIALFLEVAIHLQPVAHRVQAGTGHDHGLGLVADFLLGLGGEMVHHDSHFLPDGVRV